MSTIRNQLEDWLKTIDVKCERCLDVGGGANPVKGRTRSWEVREYKILDNELEKAKTKVDYIVDLNKDIFKEWKETTLQQFEMIFCLEVFEYIFDPMTALRNLNKLLKSGGLLFISFLFVYPHHNPEGQDYLRYTRWGVKKLLNEAGFEILELKPRVEQGGDTIRKFYRQEGMHPVKDFNHQEIGYLCKCKKI